MVLSPWAVGFPAVLILNPCSQQVPSLEPGSPWCVHGGTLLFPYSSAVCALCPSPCLQCPSCASVTRDEGYPCKGRWLVGIWALSTEQGSRQRSFVGWEWDHPQRGGGNRNEDGERDEDGDEDEEQMRMEMRTWIGMGVRIGMMAPVLHAVDAGAQDALLSSP